MLHASGWFFLGAGVLYAVAMVLSVWVLLSARREMVPWLPRLAIPGLVLHFGGLVARTLEEGGVPDLTLKEILFLVAFAAISVYLLAHFKFRIEFLGIIILPVVVALMAITTLIPDEPSRVTEGWKVSLRAVHVVPAVLGVAFLFLTFGTSIVYLIQEKGLKNHRPGRFFGALPSLERCDRLSYMSLGWGFAFLTLVVFTGALTNRYTHGDFSWVARERWALLAWVLFAVVIYDRVFAGRWRGRLSAYLSIIGLIAIILRMIGIGA
ncbi:MAG: cytochrome c biogenesis protein CcsA [Acidobacteria bacterium]|nr:cytochrome c biogenesis protein CcsA [Acidobacteriota bacterium]